MPTLAAIMTINQILIRLKTKIWLKNKGLTVVGYQAKGEIDVRQMLDVYVEALAAKQSTTAAITLVFPNIVNFEIRTTQNPDYVCGILHDFERFPTVKMFVEDELFGEEK